MDITKNFIKIYRISFLNGRIIETFSPEDAIDIANFESCGEYYKITIKYVPRGE